MTIEDIFLWAWELATVSLVVYHLYFHLRLPFHRGRRGTHKEPVSVVICARNEAENLRENLSSVLTQEHDNYEVIVVDDASSDHTPQVLETFARQYPHLRILRIEQDDPRASLPGKKAALGLGIASAANDIILLTDADCHPLTSSWVSLMSSHFDMEKIVLGYSPFERSGHLAGWLSSWDNLETAVQYFGFALAGLPYMGVGRNLAYRRSLYRKNRPLGHEAGLASGDDDLQVGAMAEPGHTCIEVHPDSRTRSNPPADLASWWSQKRRHLSTAIYYQQPVKFLLGYYGFSKLLFYLLMPWVLFGNVSQWMIYLLIARFGLAMLSLIGNAARLRKWRTIWLFPLWELITTILIATIHLANLIKPKKEAWN